MPICLLLTRSFLSLSLSPLSVAPSTAKANTRISWYESLTAHESCLSQLGGLGGCLLEESLLGRGFPQSSVTIKMRREPALQPFSVEDLAMHRVVVAHA